jgi:hypothetical protein
MMSLQLHVSQQQVCRLPKVLANFTNESTNNISNEAVTIHRSQEMLKMLPSLHEDIILQLIVSIKSTGMTFLLALIVHQTPTFTGWLQQLCCCTCTRL